MTPTIIEEAGLQFVKIPLAMFEKLSEDAEMLHDIAAYDAAKKQWLEDGQRTIPLAVVVRTLNGEPPLLVWREHRGLTQQQLSDATGVNRSLISQIESGTKTGSVASLKKLAEALKCDLDDLAR